MQVWRIVECKHIVILDVLVFLSCFKHIIRNCPVDSEEHMLFAVLSPIPVFCFHIVM